MLDRVRVFVVPAVFPTAENPTSGIFIAEQARALAANGTDVTVVFPNLRSLRKPSNARYLLRRGPIESSMRDGYRVTRRSAVRFGELELDRLFLRQARELFRWEVSQRGVPQVIHGHFALPAGAASVALGRDYGVPVVLTEHLGALLSDSYPARSRHAANEVYRSVEMTICVGSALSNVLPQDAAKTTIPNVVDTRHFQGRSGLPTNPRFLLVASLIPVKRVDLAISAVARLIADGVNCTLAIAGEGPLKTALEDQVGQLGLAGQIEFLGTLSRAELADALAHVTAVVSTSEVESFGVTLIEALAAGVPFVATDSGGPRDICVSGSGLLVESSTPAAVAAALMKVCTDPQYGTQFDGGRREYASESFGFDSVARRIKRVYEAAISS